MEVFQPVLWIQFFVLVTIEEDADPPALLPPILLALQYSTVLPTGRKEKTHVPCAAPRN